MPHLHWGQENSAAGAPLILIKLVNILEFHVIITWFLMFRYSSASRTLSHTEILNGTFTRKNQRMIGGQTSNSYEVSISIRLAVFHVISAKA